MEQEIKPRLSVLVTSFNRENFIREAIDSVLNQTYDNFELIVVDDCSCDKTFEIAKSYEDGRIRLYRNNFNLGQFANRNLAASYARGEIILFVDSDDSIIQNALEHLVVLFERYPNARFLTLNRDVFFKNEMEVESTYFIRYHLFQKSNLHYGPGATAIKTSFFHEIGGFPLLYGPAGDMFYNFKAALHSPVILCKLEFLNYRRHKGQEINNAYSYLFNGYKYFNDIMNLDNLPLNDMEIINFELKNKRRFIVNVFMFFLKTGNVFKVFKAIRNAKFGLIDFFQGIFIVSIRK